MTNFDEIERWKPFEPDEATRRFAKELEKVTKRFQPRDFLPYLSARVQTVKKAWMSNQLKEYQHTPIFRLLWAMEANCAFTRGHMRDPVDWTAMANTINVLHDAPNHLVHETLEGGALEHTLLLMYRQQIELQRRTLARDVFRAHSIFDDHYLPGLAKEFRETSGLSFLQWIGWSFVLGVGSAFNSEGVVTLKQATTIKDLAIDVATLPTFLSLAAYTPAQIGSRYRQIRNDTPARYHQLIRSAFFERPIVDFGDVILVPDSDRMLDFAGKGLHHLCKQLSGFEKEFGPTFEDYVRKVINEIPGLIGVHEATNIEKIVSPGKSCDFIVETDRSILLVECKATTMVARILTANAILKDNSTGMVAKAIVQLFTTAEDARAGKFGSMGIDWTKPIVPFVVTYGELPLVNSEWYFDKFVMKRAEGKLCAPYFPSVFLSRRPVIVSISLFEMIVVALRSSSESVSNLYDQWRAKNYVTTGDFDSHISAVLKKCSNVEENELRITKKSHEQFAAKIGSQTR